LIREPKLALPDLKGALDRFEKLFIAINAFVKAE
jgi:hypothetical protein